MKIAITIVTLLIALLSIAAGAAKIALVPDEVQFLSQFGFSAPLVIAFGIVQVLGGLLLSLPATRLYGALVTGIAFAFSAVMLSMAGNLALAGVSLVPIGLAGFVAYQGYVRRPSPATNSGDT